MRTRLAPWALLLAAVVAGGCGDARGGAAGDPVRGVPDADSGPAVTVFAAASLSGAFRDVAARFERRHPGARVTLNLAGSQLLAGQILQGAPADVFASADTLQMRRVGGSGLLAGEPAVFATNELVLAVEPGNPLRVRELADLARDDVVAVLAAPQVPAGRYARRALRAAGVGARPASLETDVKQVLAKVVLGEADAGVVYRTDVRAAGERVEAVPLPTAHQVPALYTVATVLDAPHPGAARAFADFLLSPAGREVLADHGFGPP